MRSQSLIQRLTRAVGVSIVTLGSAIAIQAIFLFPNDFRTLNRPHDSTIRQVSLFADGQRAITLLRHSHRNRLDQPEFTLCQYSLTEKGPLHTLDLGFTPWIMSSARETNRVFVATQAGDLYSFDPTAIVPKPRLLGWQVNGSSYVLECTCDGLLVVFGDVNCIGAWGTEPAKVVWQRSDIRVLGAHFHCPTDRLFCGLVEGSCVELDRHTGATLRTVATYRESIHLLDLSADGKYLATLGFNGLCTVTDIQSGDEMWSKRLPVGAGPRFSPDGKFVLAPDAASAADLQVRSTTTGELLGVLHGAKAQIARIEVTATGLVYAWDISGTFTVWELATRNLLRQSNLTS